MINIKVGWRYDNENFIIIINLFFVLRKYQILTLDYSRIYLQWLGYNNGRKIIIYDN